MKTLALIIYLAQVIHIWGPDAQHPQWDTLIGLMNTTSLSEVARFRIWNEQDGSPVMWPRISDGQLQDHCDIILKPRAAWAATFNPNNGFYAAFGSECTVPLESFQGHATIEMIGPASLFGAPEPIAWSMLSGGNWDNKAPSIEVPHKGYLLARSSWYLPYAIPNFESPDHVGANAYVTGISIQNFDPATVTTTIKYTVNQNYAQAGQSWSFCLDIPPNGGTRFDLYTQLQAAGYPAGLNSEGSLVITSDRAVRLFPSAIIATRDYLFSAGEDFQ